MIIIDIFIGNRNISTESCLLCELTCEYDHEWIVYKVILVFQINLCKKLLPSDCNEFRHTRWPRLGAGRWDHWFLTMGHIIIKLISLLFLSIWLYIIHNQLLLLRVMPINKVRLTCASACKCKWAGNWKLHSWNFLYHSFIISYTR